MNSDPTPGAEEFRLSQRNHARQVWWQIGLPLILVVLAMFAVAALVVISATGGSQSMLKPVSLSLVWLLAPVIAVAAGFLALLLAAILGLNALIKKLPAWTELLQMLFIVARWRIQQAANLSVEPVMRANTIARRLSVLTHRRRIRKRLE